MLINEGLAGQAYQRVKQALLEGKLVPGDALFESHLADQLGMSRTPVREALRVLAREGFVEASARGFSVPRPSIEDLRELFELRESLEGMAARGAAVRATDEEVRELERLCREYEEAPRLDVLATIGTSFHHKVVVAARNRRLMAMLESLNGQIILSRHSAMRGIERKPEEVIHDHRAILDAIKGRDPASAEHHARLHVRHSFDTLLRSHAGA